MKKSLLGSIIICAGTFSMVTGCWTSMQTEQAEKAPMSTSQKSENPFFLAYTTPELVPPFNTIRVEHYLPAFQEGMRQQLSEVEAICANTQAPTFANTIEALENSGQFLERVSLVFSNITATTSTDELDKLSGEVAPQLSQHSDTIYLNDQLFVRVKTVYEQRHLHSYAADQLKLLEDQYRQFVQAGASLSSDQKKELEEINKRLSVLTDTFSKNVRKDTENYRLILDKSQIAGLPEDVLAEARGEAQKANQPDKWVFTIQRSSITPFLTYADHRELRQQIYQAYQQCANNDNEYTNKAVIMEIVKLRHRQALLLGYENYAAYHLQDSMAKSTAKVYGLLDKLWPSAVQQAQSEAEELQQLIDQGSEPFALQAWDWQYYAEKVRKQKYDLDVNSLRPYFSLQATVAGAFDLANRLYGLRFVERKDLPLYHETVRTFSVFDKDNSLLGIYYLDPYRRPGKRAGAWMTNLRQQSHQGGKKISPIVINVLNFNPPASEGVSLLTLDEANTVLHEFGHALHGLLSAVNYRSQAGTSVYRDFVEFPSQLMENWLLEPEFLQTFAKHYQTGEAIPAALIKKVRQAKRFNQGFAVSEYMAAAYLDLAWHTMDPETISDVEQLEHETLARLGLPATIAPRYHSSYFQHIFSSGYAAGYYSYLWSQILDADVFAVFAKKGIFDRATGEKFRREILSKGGSVESAELFRTFRGRDPDSTALQQRLGFK